MILTRPEGRNERLAQSLRSVGLEVGIAPLIEIEPIESGSIDVGGYSWVIVTSATAARLLRERMRGTPRRVAAIGRATAEAWGARTDLIPSVATQEGLIAELPRPSGRVLFAGAENARRLLVETLDADFVALYRTKERRPSEPLRGDLVVLASPSAARAFAALELQIPAVTIGPETSMAAEDAGIRVIREAATQSTAGLVDAVLRATR